MTDHSPHQERIIKNYYKNRDSIMIQRVQELVADLYLAEGKKRQQIWKRVATALEKLGVPSDQVEHLVAQDNPAMLAERIKNLF